MQPLIKILKNKLQNAFKTQILGQTGSKTAKTTCDILITITSLWYCEHIALIPNSMEKFVLEQHARKKEQPVQKNEQPVRKNEQRRNNYVKKYVHLTDIQKNLIAYGFLKKKIC